MLARSREKLFARLIDYAGLFPPAALPMDQAVANYLRYRDGEHAWMLGKFIVPRERAGEVPSDVPVSILGVDEVKEIPADPHGIVYVEVTDLALIRLLAERGLRAKIRTGGVTADAFPSAEHVAAFIRECAEHGVPFKATAGLHHPIRCTRPLTYEPDAPRGTMHGFVNVFLAAALIHHAEEVLMESDPTAFAFDDEAASWRGHSIGTDDLGRVRSEFAISFGSCSFEEPVSDLKELGWL